MIDWAKSEDGQWYVRLGAPDYGLRTVTVWQYKGRELIHHWNTYRPASVESAEDVLREVMTYGKKHD